MERSVVVRQVVSAHLSKDDKVERKTTMVYYHNKILSGRYYDDYETTNST